MWTRIVYFSRETMVSLRRNVLMTVAGIATVAVSLALFGGILLLSKWVDHGTERIKGGVTLEIFMKVDAPADQIDGRRSKLHADPNVKSFVHFDKADSVRGVPSGSSDGTPTSRETSPPRTCPNRSGSRRNAAELTSTVRGEFQHPAGRRTGHHAG